MSFLERERARLIAERNKLFNGDPGYGLYVNLPREFVLREPAANLWEGIRADAIGYFERNGIPWHRGTSTEPTGHVLSSQVACVNHLYHLRQRPDLATAVLCAIDCGVSEAEIVDDGYVEFEFIGKHQYLKERAFTRGANCTSVDAFMIGRRMDGSRCAFLIEWKYTETYPREDKYIPERARVYDELIAATDSPFKHIESRALYFEPFYQMMRQTLLGWQLSVHADHGCTSYCNVHVVPTENTDFHRNVTSPMLRGETVSDAWFAALKNPKLYVATTPAGFMRPLVEAKDAKSLVNYLNRRYWSGT